MINRQTQETILTTLRTGGADDVTRDQLLALCNAGASKPVGPKELARELRNLVADGRVEHSWDASIWSWRYRAPRERYRLRSMLGVWSVDRAHPDIADHWTEIASATESEAIVCKTALELFMTKLSNQIAEFKTRASKRASQKGR